MAIIPSDYWLVSAFDALRGGGRYAMRGARIVPRIENVTATRRRSFAIANETEAKQKLFLGVTMGGYHSGGDRSLGIDRTKTDGLPTKPSDLGTATAAWDELLAMLEPGILRRVDALQLRHLAELVTHSRNLAAAALSDPADPKKTRSWLAVIDQVRKLGALFGLSPMDRCRLKVDTASNESDEFTEWLARGTG